LAGALDSPADSQWVEGSVRSALTKVCVEVFGLDMSPWFGHPHWGTHKRMTEMNEQESREFVRLKHHSQWNDTLARVAIGGFTLLPNRRERARL